MIVIIVFIAHGFKKDLYRSYTASTEKINTCFNQSIKGNRKPLCEGKITSQERKEAIFFGMQDNKSPGLVLYSGRLLVSYWLMH